MIGTPDWNPMPDEDDTKDDDVLGHYFRAEMTSAQRLLILDAIRAFEAKSTPLKKSAEQTIQLAEQMPGSMKDRIDFSKLDKELERRGPGWTFADLIEEGW